MNDYRLRRVRITSAFPCGCLVGGIVLLPVGLLLGLAVQALVALLLPWLGGWKEVPIDVVGFNVTSLNLLDTMGLLDVQLSLEQLAGRGWLLAAAITLAVSAGGGLFTGLLAGLAAAFYNLLALLSGGLVVEAEQLTGMAGGALPPPPTPAVWLVSTLDQNQRWPVQSTITRIGSAPGSHVHLGGLLTNHAEIRNEGNRYVLYDLSAGQAWVNNRPVAQANLLKDGFRVRLGPHEFLFTQSSP